MPASTTSHAPGVRPGMAAGGAVLSLAGVGKRYGSSTVLDSVDLEIQAGERVAIIGPSGAGKTTLLRLMCAVHWPSAGRVQALGHDTSQLSGRALRDLRRQIGLLYQSDNLVPSLRVVHNVLMGRLGHWSTARALASLLWPRELARARAALVEVELGHKLWELPGTLSGGEQQRVALARLLVQEPRILLADEPASSLDLRLAREVVALLVRAARTSGATLVASLHALELLEGGGEQGGFERVVALRAGRVFWQGRTEELTRPMLRELYGAEYRSLHLDEVRLGER